METMKEDIISKLDQSPETMKYAMLNNFTVQGTVPITWNNMHDMMILLRQLPIENLQRSIETSLAAKSVRSQSLTAGVPQGAVGFVAGQQAISHYTTWRWVGNLHSLPEHFEFPVYVYFICIYV
jgi:hypothetical protein